MGRALLLIALGCASGCAVTFGEQSCACRVEQTCFAEGYIDPSDPCRECMPEHSAEALTDVCAASITETSFEDFSDGTMARSLGNVYVAADGSLRVVRTSDLTGDGRPDLVFTNSFDGATRYNLNSYVYVGTEGGFTTDSRIELPTMGAASSASADLNADGFVDLVFANQINDLSLRDIDSFIYWGGPDGFDAARFSPVPTRSAQGCAIADLDADGYLDLVFANYFEATFATSSYVYWGSPAGYSAADRALLPTVGPSGVSIADLDANGRLDVVFSTFYNGAAFALDSYVYWGSTSGFSVDARTALPTLGSGDNTIADVNADGYLDIVFANHFDGAVYSPPSRVYLGSAAGFNPESRIEIPTLGVWATSVADLDRDGQLDYLFSGNFDGATRRIDSLVFRGSPGGIPVAPPIGLPTTGALAIDAIDVDLDGFLDVVTGSYTDGVVYARDSLVFHGGNAGPSPTAPTPLPTLGAMGGMRADLGNVYDRGEVEEYTSSPIELPGRATRLAWLAETPHGSSVALSLRSADSAEELAAAPWRGPSEDEPFYTTPFTRVSPEDAEHRFLQYRVTFRTPGFVGRPVVHEVSIYHVE